MYVSVPSHLLSLFLVFADLLLQLRILSVNATGIKGLLLFSFLVAAFAIVIGLFLFLVIRLLWQLRMPTVEKPKIKKSLLFGAFVAL